MNSFKYKEVQNNNSDIIKNILIIIYIFKYFITLSILWYTFKIFKALKKNNVDISRKLFVLKKCRIVFTSNFRLLIAINNINIYKHYKSIKYTTNIHFEIQHCHIIICGTYLVYLIRLNYNKC